MISIVLYGRNDSYGYNLHKRAALSLNCMAEVLTDPNDEILFVDYNTPDDYPTFPEAIEDTLTEKAKSLLRIFRVRPSIHKIYEKKTRLKALEPIARNIAVRRSNPTNRWILSSNTDMIFLSRNNLSLSSIVRDLEDGYYIAPRIEVPESLWEGFDRKDPSSVIRMIEFWGRRAHLNEIVTEAKEILYDGPGDFQLIKRSDLFRINGFDERMLWGWHVDFNIAKRLYLIYGQCGDMGKYLLGYHCDHTRQATPFHRPGRTENSVYEFVECVTDPVLSSQENWGCGGETIECIELEKSGSSVVFSSAILDGSKGGDRLEPVYTPMDSKTDNFYTYDPAHVLPFLVDSLINAPREWNLAWFCCENKMLELFLNAWELLGFTGKVLVDADHPFSFSSEKSYEKSLIYSKKIETMAMADVFVVDFYISESQAIITEEQSSDVQTRINYLGKCLLEIAAYERRRVGVDHLSGRRVITVNAIHNRFEPFVRSLIGVTLSPFATRIRQGYVNDDIWEVGHEENLLNKVSIGEAGDRQENRILSLPSRTGYVFHDTNVFLSPGTYELTMRIGLADKTCLPSPDNGKCILEILKGSHIVFCQGLFFDQDPDLDLKISFCEYGLQFDQSLARTEESLVDPYTFRLWTDMAPKLTVQSLHLEKKKSSIGRGRQEWLSQLYLGPAGTRDKGKIYSKMLEGLGQEEFGLVAYGPYQTMAEGSYKMTVNIALIKKVNLLCFWKKNNDVETRLEIVGPPPETVVFVERKLTFADFSKHQLEFRFRIQKAQTFPIEFRIWTKGNYPFALNNLMIEKL